MQLNVIGHHVEITESMRAYVEKRLDRVKRHFDHVIDVQVLMSVDKLQHKAEATVLAEPKRALPWWPDARGVSRTSSTERHFEISRSARG